MNVPAALTKEITVAASDTSLRLRKTPALAPDVLRQRRKRKRNVKDDPDNSLGSSQQARVWPWSGKAAKRSRPKECEGCTEIISFEDFPARFDRHGHEQDHCFNCWQIHLLPQCERTKVDDVPCIQCPLTLSEDEIRAMATKETSRCGHHMLVS